MKLSLLHHRKHGLPIRRQGTLDQHATDWYYMLLLQGTCTMSCSLTLHICMSKWQFTHIWWVSNGCSHIIITFCGKISTFLFPFHLHSIPFCIALFTSYHMDLWGEEVVHKLKIKVLTSFVHLTTPEHPALHIQDSSNELHLYHVKNHLHKNVVEHDIMTGVTRVGQSPT